MKRINKINNLIKFQKKKNRKEKKTEKKNMTIKMMEMYDYENLKQNEYKKYFFICIIFNIYILTKKIFLLFHISIAISPKNVFPRI